MRLLTLITLCLVAMPAAAQEMQKIRSITVTGMAERKVVPDEVHLTVNLNSIDKQLANAKKAHDTKLKKLLAIVDGMGIDEKKIATQHSSIQPVYNYADNKRIFQGYRISTNLDITVEETSKLGPLMDKITNAGFEQGANTEWGSLLNMYYTISEPEKIRDELLAAAIANARSKAERMADAGGAELGRVWQITEGNMPQFPPRPVPMMAMASGKFAEAAMDAAAPPAGEQELQSTVTVTFELKD